jgi:hypothetical protein
MNAYQSVKMGKREIPLLNDVKLRQSQLIIIVLGIQILATQDKTKHPLAQFNFRAANDVLNTGSQIGSGDGADDHVEDDGDSGD